MELKTVNLKWSEGCNIIVGQSHFMKTVEDISEIMSGYVPNAEYGLAFCEASEPCLIRTSGNNETLVREAQENALAVSAGHTFYLILKGCFPINILNQIKNCQEVCRIFCATANPLQIITAKTEQGCGVLGVIDGFPPKGIETEEDKMSRHDLLRKFGYKF